MVAIDFNTGWSVQPNQSIFAQLSGGVGAQPVTLPHDAMLALPRTPDAPSGDSSGYFTGGSVAYTRTLDVPTDWRNQRVSLRFDGVYRDAAVYVNGDYAGQHPNGYAPFRIALDPFLRYGEPNEVRVEARAHRDSRWYSGLGIHRGVQLHVSGMVHFDGDGPRVSTPDVDDERAVVEIVHRVTNEGVSTVTARVETRLFDPGGAPVGVSSSPVTVRAGDSVLARQRLYVPQPRRWSVDEPSLYRAHGTLTVDSVAPDESTTSFGVRTLRLDPQHGLRINDEVVKLRGACIHHDNGMLGSAAIPRAEERRIELLKAAGFNAVRAAHNMISTPMLDACDRLGMLVMDEAFDMWAKGKNPFDYSLAFPEWWERDVEAMVERDFSHPSVIMYSIGNEVLDIGTPLGAVTGRALAEKVRELDSTRYVTNGISGFVATIADTLTQFKGEVAQLDSSGGVNELMSQMDELIDQISLSDAVTEKTVEGHAVLDVAGHNYAASRYAGELERFPDRIVLGTETLATQIDRNWALVQQYPHVLGDFTWTGFDYLGEAGLGVTRYADAPDQEMPISAYPALAAYCGDLDLTGYRRPSSYYREIVFGLRADPYIAVRRPESHGRDRRALGWAWSDTVSSWTWDVEPGAPMMVEVYSHAASVELFLNGESVGVQPTGAAHRFRAEFELAYQPGVLRAVAHGGAEMSVASASGERMLSARADRDVISADPADLAYVTIEIVDADGTLFTSRDQPVTVDVTGPAVLQGLGSARPITEESYLAGSHTTFDGRLLAVLRPTGPGSIALTAAGRSLGPVTVRVTASRPGTVTAL
ncbi:glycoside hydrolase family 2 TIM barrel-domain containing protein [Microbacterium sp. DT81.1]|uniref:glycoside hydrolase family 2 TIM barrel-domain containing protein n=1 Tax=Microbacterium sp. DT81.1 TaxID=3393413 RepID=UPI003CF859BB